MNSALIGFVGLLVGVFLGESFRRRSRIEVYSQKVFERRLEVYEGFTKLVQAAFTVAERVMTDSESTEEERHDLISAAILPMAEYADNKPLYIDTYVGAPVTAMFMGSEEVLSIPNAVIREQAIADFRAAYKSTRQILLEKSGVHQINKHFRRISGSQPDSPIIRRIKELEKGRR